jgi:ABC-type transport system involved in cytochrome bd biosynthesis fused ATPase/permease subunit
MFLYYTVLIFPNLSQLGESWPMITDARTALTRLGPSSGLGEPETRVPTEAATPRFGPVVFDKVTLLGERGEPLLENVSFSVAPGEQFCLAGDSGTGKSTILSLLLGLTRPTAGRVTIGGVDASELSLSARKRFFVFARATPAFVPGPLIENIALHRSLDEAALQRILQQARLERRLSVNAVTHDATIGEKGEPFSAGEQQRIAATRLFHADQPCVILDEALNSLDEAGEIAVMKALMHDLPGKTLIVISHRRVVTTMFRRRLELLGGGQSQMIEPAIGVAAT